jgi:enterochelin esterase-like enzyme
MCHDDTSQVTNPNKWRAMNVSLRRCPRGKEFLPMVSRRCLLVGGLTALGTAAVAGVASGYELVEHGELPGKVRLDRALGRCGTVPGAPAATGVSRTATFSSRRRGVDVTYVTVLPAGVTSPRGLRVAVALHGDGGTAVSTVRDLALDHYLADAVTNRGAPPFALVAVDGGANGYWHRRADGDDPIGMIVDELLPRLTGIGAKVDRIGAIGWSMGGYGSLLLAETVKAPRMAAVVASSPAIFPTFENAQRTNHEAFDNPTDFATNNVLTHADQLTSIPTRVDCGTSDPFAPMVRRLREHVHAEGGMTGGCHDGAFWRPKLPAQLTFLADHLK